MPYLRRGLDCLVHLMVAFIVLLVAQDAKSQVTTIVNSTGYSLSVAVVSGRGYGYYTAVWVSPLQKTSVTIPADTCFDTRTTPLQRRCL
jgi:hypothetical protein